MKRIQRKRTRGWRKPDNAIIITRPGKFGNLFKVGDSVGSVPAWIVTSAGYWDCAAIKKITPGMAVDFFRVWLKEQIRRDPEHYRRLLNELRRYDAVCCYCREEDVCHGDVWIELVEMMEASEQ